MTNETELRKAEAATYANLREANAARQQEWDTDNQITLAYRGNELAGEVGEACNVIKKLERERMGIRGSRATKEQLAEELADIVICTDLIAMDAGIDLEAAVQAKFNATSEKVGLKTRLALDELTALRAKVKAQAEALTLAANRLDRLSLECPHGSSIRFDAEEWGDTARRAAQEAGQE